MTYPKWVVLQITQRCNLRCKMCYEWGENGAYLSQKTLDDLPLQTIEEVLGTLTPQGTYFELFGGEPLLHPQFKEIMQLIEKYQCKIDIPTNGTLLTRYAKEIVQAQIRRLWVSIDGPEAINDLQRGAGVYAKAIEGIRALQAEKKRWNSAYPWIGVTFVLTPLNYRYLKNFVAQELLPLGLDYISIEFQLYLTEARYRNHLQYLKEEWQIEQPSVASGLIRPLSDFESIDMDILLEQVRGADALIHAAGVKRIGYPHHIERENLMHFYRGEWDSMKEKKNFCPFPFVYMEVAANGDVTPCHTFYDFKMGNIHQRSLLDIWNDDAYVQFRSKLRKRTTPLCIACSRYYDNPSDRI